MKENNSKKQKQLLESAMDGIIANKQGSLIFSFMCLDCAAWNKK